MTAPLRGGHWHGYYGSTFFGYDASEPDSDSALASSCRPNLKPVTNFNHWQLAAEGIGLCQ